MMELNHVSAIVNMVQTDHPEDAANSQLYVVKAKRGIVTFTKCAGDLAHEVHTGMRVSGRNLNAEKLVTSFFQGRKPIPEPKVVAQPLSALSVQLSAAECVCVCVCVCVCRASRCSSLVFVP
jgi:small ligand-binding sensory domain FIST